VCDDVLTPSRWATGKLVDIGESVGIRPAQSIVSLAPADHAYVHTRRLPCGDITTGKSLPRVQELFEARVRGTAPIADVSGRVRSRRASASTRSITIIPADGGEEVVYDKLPVVSAVRCSADDGSERLLTDATTSGWATAECKLRRPHRCCSSSPPREVQSTSSGIP